MVLVDSRILDAQGAPAAIGLAHGRFAAAKIQQSLSAWRTAMAGEGHNPDELIETLARTSGFVDAVEQHTPSLLTEVEGVADGAGLTFEELFALNCLDE